MPTFQSYSAWIEVDEERLLAEEVTPEGWSKVTCWIPSTSGKIFRIGFGEETRLTSTDVNFSVDGYRCPGGKVLVSTEWLSGAPLRPKYRKGIEGPRGLLPFAFGNCQLTDDESAPLFVEGLGEIQVDFYDAQIICKRTKSSKATRKFDNEQSAALSQHRRINEKAKKALVHKVELKEEPIARSGRSRRAFKTQRGAKRVQFIFKYRPLDVLRATDVIPNTLAAVATSTANARRDLAIDEKPSVIIDLTLPPPRRTTSDAPREVIDLTLESDDDEDKNQALIARLQNELAAAKERMSKNKRKRSERDVDEDATRRVKQEPIKTESSDRTAL